MFQVVELLFERNVLGHQFFRFHPVFAGNRINCIESFFHPLLPCRVHIQRFTVTSQHILRL